MNPRGIIFHCVVGTHSCFLSQNGFTEIQKATPLTWVLNTLNKKSLHYSTNFASWLGYGTRQARCYYKSPIGNHTREQLVVRLSPDR